MAFRPTIGVVLGVSSAIGVAMFAIEGRLDGDVPMAVAVGAPAPVAGWAAGQRVRRGVPGDWFRPALIARVGLGAVVSTLAALR
mgnify:CR=1 FL=1